MATTWDEIAHDALEQKPDELITAKATNITKFGGPSIAVVTLLLAGLFGENWSLNPNRWEVVIAGAVIIAAVVLGIYHAFAADVHAREAVTVARFEAITRLARLEDDQAAAKATTDARIAALEQEKAELQAHVDRADHERDAAKVALVAARQQADGDTLAELLREIRVVAVAGNGER